MLFLVGVGQVQPVLVGESEDWEGHEVEVVQLHLLGSFRAPVTLEVRRTAAPLLVLCTSQSQTDNWKVG